MTNKQILFFSTLAFFSVWWTACEQRDCDRLTGVEWKLTINATPVPTPEFGSRISNVEIELSMLKDRLEWLAATMPTPNREWKSCCATPMPAGNYPTSCCVWGACEVCPTPSPAPNGCDNHPPKCESYDACKCCQPTLSPTPTPYKTCYYEGTSTEVPSCYCGGR